MNDLEARLVAYADGELDAETAREVEKLLETDPAAARMVEIHRETAVLLRGACAEAFYAEGPELRERRRFKFAWRPYAWAMAASVLACVVGFGGGAAWRGFPESPRQEFVEEVAEYHSVYSRETLHLVEVGAEQSDHLKTWLGRRLDRKLDIPDLRSAGLNFAGGRLLVSSGKPMAELMYTRGQGTPIALCIAPFDGKPGKVKVDQHNGLRLASWMDGRYIYVVVGDMEPAIARNLAETVLDQFPS